MVYKTPGVYVEEKSTLPPSVAEVSTAVPAFIGYTEKGYVAAKGPTLARVTTLLEYRELFGGPKTERYTVTGDLEGGIAEVSRDVSGTAFSLYHALDHYFKNGGGACWVVSVGDYTATPKKDDFSAGITRLETEDEPTLVVLTDAAQVVPTDYHALCGEALNHCAKMKDRFAILDVADGKTGAFRNASMANLMFGAAYYPSLDTTLVYPYLDKDVTIKRRRKTLATDTIEVSHAGTSGSAPSVEVVVETEKRLSFAATADKLTINVAADSTGITVAAEFAKWKAVNDAKGFAVVASGHGTAVLTKLDAVAVSSEVKLDAIRSTEAALYNRVKARLEGERITLPPSAAIAGIYASVDRDRGVWKAPANVAVSAVLGPTIKITNEDQENLNIDPSGAGKSINAIRAFTGKGTLVWGARTLAGQDNEWKFVPVRRLFLVIEESVKKATSFAVFEPNDMTTWLKVKGMIESYLYGLWERGALAGSKPDAAYYVNVGLGKTMTTDDILNGRMNVEIGIAAVRPAEFIVLRFSHMLQQA